MYLNTHVYIYTYIVIYILFVLINIMDYINSYKNSPFSWLKFRGVTICAFVLNRSVSIANQMIILTNPIKLGK